MINRKIASIAVGLLATTVAGSASAATAFYSPLYSLAGSSTTGTGTGTVWSPTATSLHGPSYYTESASYNSTSVSGFSGNVATQANNSTTTFTTVTSPNMSQYVGGVLKPGYTSTGSGFAYVFETAFSFGSGYTGLGTVAPSKLDLTLSQTTSGSTYLGTSNFFVEDLTTSTLVAGQTVTSTGGHGLELIANINPNGNTDKYAFFVTVPSTVSSHPGSFTVSGSVPLPGTLAMFGAFLLGLVALRYGVKQQQTGW